MPTSSDRGQCRKYRNVSALQGRDARTAVSTDVARSSSAMRIRPAADASGGGLGRPPEPAGRTPASTPGVAKIGHRLITVGIQDPAEQAYSLASDRTMNETLPESIDESRSMGVSRRRTIVPPGPGGGRMLTLTGTPEPAGKFRQISGPPRRTAPTEMPFTVRGSRIVIWPQRLGRPRLFVLTTARFPLLVAIRTQPEVQSCVEKTYSWRP